MHVTQPYTTQLLYSDNFFKVKSHHSKKLTHFYFLTIHRVIDKMHSDMFFDNINADVNRMIAIFWHDQPNDNDMSICSSQCTNNCVLSLFKASRAVDLAYLCQLLSVR